ncbi:putative photosystem II PsbK [Helianthus annuus]|uniref:Photosystem II PsbK n=1 Tax=Helianthus annuus TaxID=4232 RepID=A0A9K3E3D8_HELAN|nr:putative photosystem II PsbK [Helianthus annuus]KAJ0457465.1 putative photosystem II PsbK [Helianthus annuus]KAJ0832791.1 putative photosystem II PsbK [Helianthus annuus]
MFVMLNIFSLICLNSALYPSSLFFAKLPEAYAFLNPIVDVMPVIQCPSRHQRLDRNSVQWWRRVSKSRCSISKGRFGERCVLETSRAS